MAGRSSATRGRSSYSVQHFIQGRGPELYYNPTGCTSIMSAPSSSFCPRDRFLFTPKGGPHPGRSCEKIAKPTNHASIFPFRSILKSSRDDNSSAQGGSESP